jgi:hypothetical protein
MILKAVFFFCALCGLVILLREIVSNAQALFITFVCMLRLIILGDQLHIIEHAHHFFDGFSRVS